MSRCPECGRFVSNVVAWQNGLDEIRRVEGTCKVHGRVALDDWNADQFVWDDEEVTT